MKTETEFITICASTLEELIINVCLIVQKGYAPRGAIKANYDIQEDEGIIINYRLKMEKVDKQNVIP